ncbi:hypothetical protein SLE2022_277750 [Rubroshorea leprosula]
MEVVKNSRMGTPMKDPHGSQSRNREISKSSENSNPNVSRSSPSLKPSKSPLSKSGKSLKSASKNQGASTALNPVLFSPRNKIRERKFVVAKKNSKKEKSESNTVLDCKCKEKFGGNNKKCVCVAYETLRASQEEFFKNRAGLEDDGGVDDGKSRDRAESGVQEKAEKGSSIQNPESQGCYGSNNQDPVGVEYLNQKDTSTLKRSRDKLLDEVRNSVPSFGKVMNLVQAFEKLLSIPNSKESEKNDEEADENNADTKEKPVKWTLPGMQTAKVPDMETKTQFSSSSFCASDLVLTAENLGLDSRFSVSSSWDSSKGSISGRTSNGGRRSRRNSSDSCGTMGGRRWKKKQPKVTSQKPFKLRTEQRGKVKEEEFVKKVQERMMEEEKQRIPIAQGLPWTTDEPEILIKPPVKENTMSIDLKLHSDLRAVERAEFDYQVAEKMSLIEQYKMERERQQKLAEEEEIKRLRKELVPKAQPMPYFDRPFIPRRSMKLPTIPREPKFHIPQHKKMKCCLSWNDISSYTFQHQGNEA